MAGMGEACNWNFPDLTGLVTENGEYTLTIPAGVITVGEDTNPEYVFTYTLNDPSLDKKEYPAFVLGTVTPEAGTAMPYVGERTYTFTSNVNQYVRKVDYYWYDVTEGAETLIAQAYAEPTVAEGEPISVNKNGTTDLMYENHEYEMR